jgi:hypothetical protein
VLGKDYLDTITNVANVASICCSRGRLREAEELSIQLLETQNKAFGDGLASLASLHNLAFVFMSQARTKEAIDTMIRLVATRVHKLGEGHPNI